MKREAIIHAEEIFSLLFSFLSLVSHDKEVKTKVRAVNIFNHKSCPCLKSWDFSDS